jgi:predicted DCC family thiol-disulfide oxidoreductase YuxK
VSTGTDTRPTFLYDGDCAFCSSFARFIERRIATPVRVVPYQFADLEPLGVTEAECTGAVQWADPTARGTSRPSTAAGPLAIARLLRSSTGPAGRLLWRPLGLLLGLRPVLRMAWPAYHWVADHRHRLPGGSPACALPRR